MDKDKYCDETFLSRLSVIFIRFFLSNPMDDIWRFGMGG